MILRPPLLLPLAAPTLLPRGVSGGMVRAGSRSPHDVSFLGLTGGQGLLHCVTQSLTGFQLQGLTELRLQGATAAPEASQRYALTARKSFSPFRLIVATPPNQRGIVTRRVLVTMLSFGVDSIFPISPL